MKRTILMVIILTLLFNCGCSKSMTDEIPDQTEDILQLDTPKDDYKPPVYPVKEVDTPVALPVLMYHHFTLQEAKPNSTIVSAKSFKEQMTALKNAGYTTITPYQLNDFMLKKAGLPEKPIMITMDDGYRSNMEIAAPILKELGMNATVFTICVNVNKTDINSNDIPKFYWQDANEWVRNGTFVIQSHTFDMHQKASQGISGRDGAYQKPDETDEEYIAALKRDAALAKLTVEAGMFSKYVSVAFPYGFCTEAASREFANSGAKLQFTTVYGVNYLKPDENYECLALKRWSIGDEMTGSQLVEGLEQLIKNKK